MADTDNGNDRAKIQTSQFLAFKRELEEEGLLDRPKDIALGDQLYGLSDDVTLLRFFTAHKCKIPDAIDHFRKATQFRQANHICRLYDEISVAKFEESCNMYPQWTGRLCKKGQPIYIFDSARLDCQTIAAYKKSSKQLANEANTSGRAETEASPEMVRSVLCFDHLTRFVLPLCSALRHYQGYLDVSKITLIVDLTGMRLGQIWNLKSYLQDFIQLLSLNFPEILDKVYITRAPSAFPVIWKLLKSWADPQTVSKFVIVAANEMQQILQAQVEIDDLPKKYGGMLEYEYGMRPLLDTGIQQMLVWNEMSDTVLPEGPLKWVQGAQGVDSIAASGSENGSRRSEKNITLRNT